jgi:hypothetical protein
VRELLTTSNCMSRRKGKSEALAALDSWRRMHIFKCLQQVFQRRLFITWLDIGGHGMDMDTSVMFNVAAEPKVA